MAVCMRTYIAMYGIITEPMNSLQKKIKTGCTSESSLPSDYKFSMKEAFDVLDMDLAAFRATNGGFFNFDSVAPINRTLIFTAWFADYLDAGGGEPEVRYFLFLYIRVILFSIFFFVSFFFLNCFVWFLLISVAFDSYLSLLFVKVITFGSTIFHHFLVSLIFATYLTFNMTAKFYRDTFRLHIEK